MSKFAMYAQPSDEDFTYLKSIELGARPFDILLGPLAILRYHGPIVHFVLAFALSLAPIAIFNGHWLTVVCAALTWCVHGGAHEAIQQRRLISLGYIQIGVVEATTQNIAEREFREAFSSVDDSLSKKVRNAGLKSDSHNVENPDGSIDLKELLLKDFGVALPISGGTGSSRDNAIVIHPTAPNDFVGTEYFILKCIMAGRRVSYETIQQELLTYNGKTLDKIKVQISDASSKTGAVENYYFDITACKEEKDRRDREEEARWEVEEKERRDREESALRALSASKFPADTQSNDKTQSDGDTFSCPSCRHKIPLEQITVHQIVRCPLCLASLKAF